MNLFASIVRRHRINCAVRELSSLSNDMLQDIGVNRGDIVAMVEHMVDSRSIEYKARNAGHGAVHHAYPAHGATVA